MPNANCSLITTNSAARLPGISNDNVFAFGRVLVDRTVNSCQLSSACDTSIAAADVEPVDDRGITWHPKSEMLPVPAEFTSGIESLSI